MKFAYSAAAAILATSLSLTAFAGNQDCDKPDKPKIPEGDSASEKELIATQKVVKEYVAAGQAYLECNDAKREQLLESYNATVDEMKETSDTFNKSVQAFKSAN